MKVNELRTALKQYDTATLQEMVVALYKIIPKSRKEDNGIDELLLDFTKEKTKTAAKEPAVDFPALQAEIEQFLDFADMQYYMAPNQFVRKDKRSKWRFEVKRFIKALLAVSGENSEEAARLLAAIYQMLCYACDFYIFSTENPFSAVGYQQTELLKLTLGKIFYSGFDEAAIKKAVFLTLDSNVDRETLPIGLFFVLLDMLKTPGAREEALAQCKAYKKGYAAYQSEKEVFRTGGSFDDFRQGEHCNYAVELYLLLKCDLHEYDEGVAYFWENYKEWDQEITLYCLLDFLGLEDLDDLWIREYENAVKKGIEPRDNLEAQYTWRKTGQAR